MQIQFKQIQFTDVSFKVDTETDEYLEGLENSLKIEYSFNDSKSKRYSIVFYFQRSNANNTFNLKIKAEAHFTTDEDIDEEFKKSSFVKANSPAIAFPFVRTFISNFTLNSGFTPLVLPSINFVKLSETNEGSI